MKDETIESRASRAGLAQQCQWHLSVSEAAIVRVPELGLGGRDREGAAARVTPEVEKHGGWGKRAKKTYATGAEQKKMPGCKNVLFYRIWNI